MIEPMGPLTPGPEAVASSAAPKSQKPFVTFHAFFWALATKKHNLNADPLKIVLAGEVPSVEEAAVKGDVAEIAPSGGYMAGGVEVKGTFGMAAPGVFALSLEELVVMATGGPIGPFTCAVLVNGKSERGDLIGYWHLGKAITLEDGESYAMKFPGPALVLGGLA